MKKEWQQTSVGEILQLEYGKPLDDNDRKPNGRFPVYGANGEKDRTDKFYYAKPSIVVGRKGSAGEINLTEQKFWPLDVTYFVTFDENQHDLRFLYYLLTTLELPKLAKGVKPGINRNEVYSLPTNVPPLAAQQWIVGVLDEAFAALTTAQAHAETNLQNARALFESHLQSVFTHRGKGWVETVLGDEVDFAAGFAFKSAGYVNAKNGTRLLRGDNIMQGEFRWEDAAYWPSKDTLTYDRFRLVENDIVLAMDRPWVAAGLKIACVSSEDIPCLQVQRTARLRVSKRLSWRYLFHLLRSQEFVSYLLDGQTGLGVPHISGKQILAFQFFQPSLDEQQQIVAKLDALATETQRLARHYEQKQAALAALKKSLLHQAFTGEL